MNKIFYEHSFKITRVKIILLFLCVGFIFSFSPKENLTQWIRINQLGYTPGGIKVAVWCSKDESPINTFTLIDSATGKLVLTQNAGKSFGSMARLQILIVSIFLLVKHRESII